MNLFGNFREEHSKRTYAQDGRLTNNQICKLAESIKASDMETIAMTYLDVDWEEVQYYSKRESRVGAFNRAMIRKWAYHNPGPNQVKV